MDPKIAQDIAKYLPNRDVVICQCVCKDWKRLFRDCEVQNNKKMCGWPPRPAWLSKRISPYLDLRIYHNY